MAGMTKSSNEILGENDSKSPDELFQSDNVERVADTEVSDMAKVCDEQEILAAGVEKVSLEDVAVEQEELRDTADESVNFSSVDADRNWTNCPNVVQAEKARQMAEDMVDKQKIVHKMLAVESCEEYKLDENKADYDLNGTQEDKIKALYQSALDKNYEKLIALVKEQKVDIDHAFTESFIELHYRGWRLIHFMCKKGSKTSLETIISLGADPTVKTRNGDTALHICCKHGYFECVEYLLKVDNSLKDVKNSQGITPLMKALFRCDTVFKEHVYKKIIKALINSGCNVNLCPDSNVSPLHVLAGKWNTPYLMNLLLNAGADVNTIAVGKSPLMTALCRQKVDTAAVKLLIESGACVNQLNLEGKFPLHIAVSKSEDKCVEYLLSAGADPNAEDASGYTPLWFAICDNNITIAPLLLKYGANVNWCNKTFRMSLLCNAANRRHKNMVKLLLEYGADVNAETALGATALHYAIDEEDIEIVKMLIQKNCYMDNYSLFKDIYNPHSAFQIALIRGEEEIIKLLCRVGCPIPEFSLRPDRLPSIVKDDEELIKWLHDFYHNPQTLGQLCRLEFRRLCGTRLQEVIDGLLFEEAMPHRLADYVLMADLLE